MKRWRQCAAVVFVAALGLVSCGRPSSPASPYAGTWVLEASGRPFIVLTLSPLGGGLGGTLAMPSWSTADGVTFTNVHGPIAERSVTVTVADAGGIRLTIADPANPANPDVLTVSRKDDEHVSVGYEGAPLPPWVFVRAAADTRVSADWDPRLAYAIARPPVPPNDDMTRIFDEDQKDRATTARAGSDEWARIGARDAERRRRTRALLDANSLHAGADFRNAAFVFQHGESPNDFLTAHALALVALARGDSGAAWIAAASMDRYLRSVGKPAIYGTGFVEKPDGTLVEEEPFDRAALSDGLRRGVGVRPVQEWADAYRAATARR